LLLKPTSPFIDHKLVNEILKYFKKGILIKILTEGEKYLITIFYLISYEEQAIYYMIYLLGSIFPCFIFSTIEQSFFDYFQQTFRNQQSTTPSGIHSSIDLYILWNSRRKIMSVSYKSRFLRLSSPQYRP